jgi:transposase InsO family protein
LGSSLGRWRDRSCPFDGLEGAQAAGLSRSPRAVSEQANSYEWPCPGDLLHMDVSRYARFLRPGHRVTGDRSQRSRNWMRPETRVGYDFAHAIVDDHSRLAYVELHEDEKAATVTGFVERALTFFAEHGIVAKRLMTDNGFSYVKNRSLRELLASRSIRHLTTEPYRPHTNGKVERFHHDGTRVGLRTRLPLTSTPQRRPGTLARQLQPTTTPQLNRRPPTNQPRSQRPWVGQLDRVAQPVAMTSAVHCHGAQQQHVSENRE